MSTASASDSPQSVVRYAEQLAQGCQMVPQEAGIPTVCLMPLKEESVSTAHTFRSYSFGKPSRTHSPHKVIMVVGETGTGKSTLINAMANYMLGVKWEDNLRFKLVIERGEASGSQAYSQTQNITSYTIHSNNHINVPYTFTIINTPGYADTRGFEHDKIFADKIKDFFTHPEAHGVDHIDAVGFVVKSSQARLTQIQRYVFESIQYVFGKDIEPNVLLLITFCDSQSPKVLDAVKAAKLPYADKFKFNNATLFASREDQFGAIYWPMVYESMNEFFEALDHLEPRSLLLTVEVLEERRRLEIALNGVQRQIQLANDKMEQLNNDKKMLEEHEQEIEANKSFEYEDNVAMLQKIPDQDKRSTNCPKCLYTCHHPCTFSQAKFMCHAMKRGYCTVCPGKCPSSEHVHGYFRYHWKMVKEKRTYADVENRYREAQGQKQTREEVIKYIEADLVKSEAAVSELIKESHRCIQRLQEIALKPNPVGIIDYLELSIESEKASNKPGWEKRVGSLIAAKQRENTKAKVRDADADASGILLENFWNTVTKPFENIAIGK